MVVDIDPLAETILRCNTLLKEIRQLEGVIGSGRPFDDLCQRRRFEFTGNHIAGVSIPTGSWKLFVTLWMELPESANVRDRKTLFEYSCLPIVWETLVASVHCNRFPCSFGIVCQGSNKGHSKFNILWIDDTDPIIIFCVYHPASLSALHEFRTIHAL